MSSKAVKGKTRAILEGIFCIIIIVFLLSRMNITKAAYNLAHADPKWIVLGMCIYTLSILLTAYSLKALFDSVKHTNFKEWMHLYLLSFSMGLVLPGRAGDLSIIYFAKKKGFDIGASTALTITDKLITLIVFGAIAAIGLLTLLKSSQLVIGVLFTAFCILLGMFLFTSVGRKIIVKLIGKYAERFQGFYKTFKNLLRNHKGKVLINIGITLLRPIGNALLIILIFKAIGIEVSFLYAILINAVTLIASLVPLTPNGLGIREGIGSFLFTQIGIPLEASLAMYLIILMMNYATGIIGVSYYLWKKKKKFSAEVGT